jgi:hypothetical protein
VIILLVGWSRVRIHRSPYSGTERLAEGRGGMKIHIDRAFGTVTTYPEVVVTYRACNACRIVSHQDRTQAREGLERKPTR